VGTNNGQYAEGIHKGDGMPGEAEALSIDQDRIG
jgi:hypothetical protein